MPQTDRSIPELTKDMAFHLGDILRNEMKLARVEATEGVKSLSGAAGMLAGGAVVGISALTLALLAAAFAGAAALVAGAVVFAGAFFAVAMSGGPCWKL